MSSLFSALNPHFKVLKWSMFIIVVHLRTWTWTDSKKCNSGESWGDKRRTTWGKSNEMDSVWHEIRERVRDKSRIVYSGKTYTLTLNGKRWMVSFSRLSRQKLQNKWGHRCYGSCESFINNFLTYMWVKCINLHIIYESK